MEPDKKRTEKLVPFGGRVLQAQTSLEIPPFQVNNPVLLQFTSVCQYKNVKAFTVVAT